TVKGLDHAFMMRVFYLFAALALGSAAIALAGKWYGSTIAMAGYSDDPTLREIVIGNSMLSVPANAIRFEHARHGGMADRLDIYLRWPDMTGYTAAAAPDFNNAGGRRNILFLTFGKQAMSRDMSGRFEPIYRSLIEARASATEGDVAIHDFKPDS